MRDLLFIEEGNPSTLEGGLINFAKLRMVANIIANIQDMQRVQSGAVSTNGFRKNMT